MGKSKAELGETSENKLNALHRPHIRMGEPSVFARNLRLLTAMRGLTAEAACKGIVEMIRREANTERIQAWDLKKGKDACKLASERVEQMRRLKIDPKWYRRLTSKGVSRSDQRTILQFYAIARFFEVPHEGLWKEDLITLKLADLQEPILPPTHRFAVHAQKLAELLEHGGGRYDYLMMLLASLHAEAFPHGQAGTPLYKSGAFTMPDTD